MNTFYNVENMLSTIFLYKIYYVYILLHICYVYVLNINLLKRVLIIFMKLSQINFEEINQDLRRMKLMIISII